jgi:hypothetical protein
MMLEGVMERKNIKPQDILVLSKLIELKSKSYRQIDLASELGISQAEIVHSMKRLELIGLYNRKLKSLNKLSIIEFVEHALKFIFPTQVGAYSRGIPTVESSLFLSGKIASSSGVKYVWPSAEGSESGIVIQPIYHSVPKVVQNNDFLKKILNIIDIFRGNSSVRVKKIASTELRKIVLGHL